MFEDSISGTMELLETIVNLNFLQINLFEIYGSEKYVFKLIKWITWNDPSPIYKGIILYQYFQ